MTKVFDSFRLMFVRIRLCLRALARRGRPRPSPTAVSLVVVVPFVVVVQLHRGQFQFLMMKIRFLKFNISKNISEHLNSLNINLFYLSVRIQQQHWVWC